MKILFYVGLAAASLSALAVSGAAIAGDEDDARVAIAAAKAKLDAAEKAGAGGNAGDVLNRSRSVLDEANAQFRKDEDRHALVLAQEADALADLAVATAELRALETERSKIAVN
ncbi:hypothetical protein [Rhizorhabdus argentea]|uniref:hypothetical protein n=1 Tax=Rhizorhabdus argentea TaxID=1387174 RepID=UPI0030EBFEF5